MTVALVTSFFLNPALSAFAQSVQAVGPLHVCGGKSSRTVAGDVHSAAKPLRSPRLKAMETRWIVLMGPLESALAANGAEKRTAAAANATIPNLCIFMPAVVQS